MKWPPISSTVGASILWVAGIVVTEIFGIVEFSQPKQLLRVSHERFEYSSTTITEFWKYKNWGSEALAPFEAKLELDQTRCPHAALLYHLQHDDTLSDPSVRASFEWMDSTDIRVRIAGLQPTQQLVVGGIYRNAVGTSGCLDARITDFGKNAQQTTEYHGRRWWFWIRSNPTAYRLAAYLLLAAVLALIYGVAQLVRRQPSADGETS